MKVDHFLDHVERGRRRRLAAEREARGALDRPAERTRLAAPTPIPDDVRLELEKPFGPGWRHSHALR
jgi:hypothetical protein